MPLTKTDIQNINAFLKEGSVEAARRILLNSDDDRAEVMLARIDAKYPPKATPPVAIVTPKSAAKSTPAVDPLDAVKGLIAQKKYDDAEALLWTMDSPESEELLRKLKIVQSAGGTSAAVPVKAKNATSGKPHYLRNILLASLVAVLLVCGVLFYVGIQQSNAAGRQLGMRFDMQDVCYASFRDDYPDMSADAFYDACKKEAESVIASYEASVSRCYDEWKDETQKEIHCLNEAGVMFEGIWLFGAAHP